MKYSGQIGAYSQTYCIAPGQTYVIEAPEELPYEIADKQPQKFYSEVLNQPIKKCVVKNRGRLRFMITKRPLLKIINSIKNKLMTRMTRELGEWAQPDIAEALENEEIQDQLLEMVDNEQIELVDKDNQPFLQKQITALS